LIIENLCKYYIIYDINSKDENLGSEGGPGPLGPLLEPVLG